MNIDILITSNYTFGCLLVSNIRLKPAEKHS